MINVARFKTVIFLYNSYTSLAAIVSRIICSALNKFKSRTVCDSEHGHIPFFVLCKSIKWVISIVKTPKTFYIFSVTSYSQQKLKAYGKICRIFQLFLAKSEYNLWSKTFTLQSPSHVKVSETPWTAAYQASLSLTVSLSLLKLMSIESVMPSNHLSPCCPLLFLSSIFPRIMVGSLHQAVKVFELQLQHQSFQWIFRVNIL